MKPRLSRTFPGATSLLLGALLLAPTMQQKGCDQKGAAKPPATPAGEFSVATAERDVRRRVDAFRLALESKSPSSVMSVVDPNGLGGYGGFEMQISDLLESADELRVHFRVASLQVRSPGGPDKPALAQALVDAQLFHRVKGNQGEPRSQSAQLQMDLVLGEMGWRFVKIEPRSFFTLRDHIY